MNSKRPMKRIFALRSSRALVASAWMIGVTLGAATARAESPQETAPESDASEEAPPWVSPSDAPADPGASPPRGEEPSAAEGSAETRTESDESNSEASSEGGEATSPAGSAKDSSEPVAGPVEANGKAALSRVSSAPPKDKAVDPPPTAPIDYEALPLTYHQVHIDVGVGPRLNWLFDDAFDLFSDGDLLASLAVRAGSTVWVRERSSLAVIGEWERGGSSGSARGLDTRFDMNRFLLGVEGRYHVVSRLAGYGRFSAGLVRQSSRIGPEAKPTTLEHSSNDFSVVLTLGTAVRLFGSPDGRQRTPRGHLYLEAGYSYVAPDELSFRAGDDGPLRAEPVELGTLSLGGPQLGAGVLITL